MPPIQTRLVCKIWVFPEIEIQGIDCLLLNSFGGEYKHGIEFKDVLLSDRIKLFTYKNEILNKPTASIPYNKFTTTRFTLKFNRREKCMYNRAGTILLWYLPSLRDFQHIEPYFFCNRNFYCRLITSIDSFYVTTIPNISTMQALRSLVLLHLYNTHITQTIELFSSL